MFKFLVLLILSSCSGYRFSQQENPLAQYGIQSISVPMFYNYSNIPEVQSDFTKEIYRLFTSYSGLKLYNGYNPSADAVVIGIIKSPQKLTDTIRAQNLRLAQGVAKNKIGNVRQNFYVPGTSDVQLFLQFIVIKKPTEEELALLKSGIGDQVRSSSRIVINEIIPLRFQYTREYLDNEGTEVVGTQNAGVQRRAFSQLAEQAALSVRDLVLYAF